MTIEFDIDKARSFVARQDIPVSNAGMGLETPVIDFDTAKKQALVVGSDVISFDTGVESEFRQAISDSALLAQLVANRNADSSDPIAWFDAYFGVLGNIGWVTQTRDTATYQIKVDGVEVHEAILEVVSAFIGSVPGALALVKLSLDSLKAMNKDSPLITLFNKESQRAKIGRFQFTIVRPDDQGGLLAEAMAFALNAEKSITQILFFKLHKTKATLRRSLGTVSLNRSALTALQPVVRRKVESYLSSYVAALDLAPLPA